MVKGSNLVMCIPNEPCQCPKLLVGCDGSFYVALLVIESDKPSEGAQGTLNVTLLATKDSLLLEEGLPLGSRELVNKVVESISQVFGNQREASYM